MSIATEIQRLQQAKIDIKAAIENKGISVGDGKIDTYAEKISEISSGGGSQAVDFFPYMKTVQFSDRFSEITEPTKPMVFHFEEATSLQHCFYSTFLFCPKITVYVSEKCTNMAHAFRYGGFDETSTIEEIEVLGDTSKITSYNQAFYYRPLLKRIKGYFDFSSCTNVSNMFGGCVCLQEFYPVANTIKVPISFANSPNLIPECKQAIIDGLADLTGQTTQTITFYKNIVLTEEQKATITLKNWTLVQ